MLPGWAAIGWPITGSAARPNTGDATAPGDPPNPLANPDWKLCVAFTNGDPPPSPCGLVTADGADGAPATGLPDTAPPPKELPDNGFATLPSPAALPNDDEDGIDGIDGADGEDGIDGIDGDAPPPGVTGT